jgi:hypothetical protein
MTIHLRGRIAGYTPEPEYAAETGVTLATQRRKRRLGDCPAYIVVARQVHYCDADKERYFKTKLVLPPRSVVA